MIIIYSGYARLSLLYLSQDKNRIKERNSRCDKGKAMPLWYSSHLIPYRPTLQTSLIRDVNKRIIEWKRRILDSVVISLLAHEE
jgi:hypothetical protein